MQLTGHSNMFLKCLNILLSVCPEGNHVDATSHASDWNCSQIMSLGYKNCLGSVSCICLRKYVCTYIDRLERQLKEHWISSQ